MTMTVKTAATSPLALKAQAPAPAAAATPGPVTFADECPPEQMAADQNDVLAGAGRTSTATLSLTGANTVRNSNNNITVINNFQGRPKAEKPEAAPKRENFFQLVGRAFGQLFNNLTFGFFGGLARGLRGEGAPAAEGAR